MTKKKRFKILSSIFSNNNSQISWIRLLFILLLLAYLIIFSAWNSENSDFFNYRDKFFLLNSYKHSIDGNYGFSYLLLTFKKLGFDFFTTRKILFIFFFTIFTIFVCKWSSTPIIILLAYIGFHFIRDVIELKNFYGFVTILVGLGFLVKQTKKSRIITLLLILLAGSFHVAYYVLLPIVFTKNKKRLPIAPFILSFCIIALLSQSMFRSVLTHYSPDFLEEKLDQLQNYSGNGALILSLIVVLGTILVSAYYYHRANLKNQTVYRIQEIPVKNYAIFIYNLNILSSSILVFSPLSYSFIPRLYTVVILFDMIFICNYLYLERKNLNLLDIGIAAIYYYSVYISTNMAVGHYMAVYNNNLIFPYFYDLYLK